MSSSKKKYNLIAKSSSTCEGYWIEQLLINIELLDYKKNMKTYIDPCKNIHTLELFK